VKLLYIGGVQPPFSDLKRLLLLGSELSFMDRPSVTFKDWGTIGRASPMRSMDSTGSPVSILVHEPPSGPAKYGYEEYVEADLENPRFREAVLNGLRADDRFARKFLQFNADYGGLKGRDLRDQIIADSDLLTAKLTPFDPKAMKDGTATPAGRRAAFHMLLAEASIEVTAAQYVASHTGSIPISEVPAFASLLSLRTADSGYVGDKALIAPWLAASIVEAVVPDSLLQQLELKQILEYRHKTKDAYDGFMAEVERLTAVMGEIDSGKAVQEIPRIIAGEVTPRVTEFRDEMLGARDELFADLLKKVIVWEVPAVSVGFLSGNSFAAAAVAFLGIVGAAAPGVIDYVVKERAIKRKNAFAYLLGVRPPVQIEVKR
jgi:hypothetical protein